MESYSNSAATTLSAALTTTNGTSISVTAATGFPSSGQYRIIIDAEIMIVTAGQGTTTWTVTRGAESTTAATHLVNAAVTHVVTAASLARVVEGRAVVASADASYDFSSATGLWLPQSAGAAPANTGQIAHDTTQRTTKVRDSIAGVASISRVLSCQYASADTLTASTITTTETVFATKYTIPANFFILSKCIRVTAAFDWTTSTTPVTFNFRLRLGGLTGAILYASGADTMQASKTGWNNSLVFSLMGTGAAGASVGVHCGLIGNYSGTSTFGPSGTTQPVNVATNASQDLVFTMQFGGSTAGNSLSLRQLIAEEMN